MLLITIFMYYDIWLMALQDNAVALFGSFLLSLVHTESFNLIKIQSSDFIYKPPYPEVLSLIFHILSGLQREC